MTKGKKSRKKRKTKRGKHWKERIMNGRTGVKKRRKKM